MSTPARRVIPGAVEIPGVEIQRGLRASDADRARHIAYLARCHEDGSIDGGVFTARMEAAAECITRDELEALTADLPPLAPCRKAPDPDLHRERLPGDLQGRARHLGADRAPGRGAGRDVAGHHHRDSGGDLVPGVVVHVGERERVMDLSRPAGAVTGKVEAELREGLTLADLEALVANATAMRLAPSSLVSGEVRVRGSRVRKLVIAGPLLPEEGT
jgi:DUF1707 SHOCT-like domain